MPPYLTLPDPNGLQIGLTIGSAFLLYLAVFKAAVPIWEWFRDGAGWVGDIVAVVRGRKERIDRVTGEHRRAVPSLVDALVQIRDKQDDQGRSIDNLTAVVTQVADQQITLNEHTKQISDLRLGQAIANEQIGMLKAAGDERRAIHEETAKLFDMVTKRDSDVINEGD